MTITRRWCVRFFMPLPVPAGPTAWLALGNVLVCVIGAPHQWAGGYVLEAES